MQLPRSAFLFILLALLAGGCTGERSRVVTQPSTTTFLIEHTLDRWIFGSATHVIEIEVDNAKLQEHRPLVVGELLAVRLRNQREDPAQLDGFLWYLPHDGKAVIAIGYKQRNPDDRTVTPLVIGEYAMTSEWRRH